LPAGASANRTIDVIEQVEQYFMGLPQVENIITVQGFSFNGNGLNAAIAFSTLKDFSERKGPGDSAGAIAFAAFQKQLMGIHDAQVFTLVPPAISSLGYDIGFDFRLQDCSSAGLHRPGP